MYSTWRAVSRRVFIDLIRKPKYLSSADGHRCHSEGPRYTGQTVVIWRSPPEDEQRKDHDVLRGLALETVAKLK